VNLQEECKKKKVAICYRGHFYREDPRKGLFGKPDVNSNFFKCYPNNIEILFRDFGEVDVFLHTYCAGPEKNEKLIELLNPKKFKVEQFRRRRHDLTNSIIKSANLVDPSEYDLIINTRFDLIYKNHIWRYDLQFDKFNFIYREPFKFWSANRAVCDLMHIYNPRYHADFIKAAPLARDKFALHKPKEYKRKRRAALHFLYDSLDIPDEEKNFLIKQHYHSNTSIRVSRKNPFIKINRSL
jgi:hypothetical protein